MANDSGSLSVGDRLSRIEENVEAVELSQQIKNRDIWQELNRMQRDQTELKIDMVRHTTKLTIVVSIAVFAVSLLAQWVMRHVGG